MKLIPKRKLALEEFEMGGDTWAQTLQYITNVYEVPGPVCPVRCYRVEASGRLKIPVGADMYGDD